MFILQVAILYPLLVLLQSMDCLAVIRDCHIQTTPSQNTTLSPVSHPQTFYASMRVRSSLSCASRCVKDHHCQAFFAVPNHDVITSSAPRQGFWCWLLSIPLTENQLMTGTAIYGRLVTMTSSSGQPGPMAISGGKFKKYVRTQQGPAALYNCTGANSRMTDVALLKATGPDSDQWSILSPQCTATLCQQSGFSGTLWNMSVGADADTFRVTPVCKSSEWYSSHADCDSTGSWTFSQSDLKVGCIPANCYRVNQDGRAAYKGNKSTTDTGITCHPWDVIYYSTQHKQVPSRFLEEGGDRAAANNYCRDPEPSDRPWCYKARPPDPSVAWDYCDIPRCVTDEYDWLL